MWSCTSSFTTLTYALAHMLIKYMWRDYSCVSSVLVVLPMLVEKLAVAVMVAVVTNVVLMATVVSTTRILTAAETAAAATTTTTTMPTTLH